jgi:hypothetical protein
VTNRSDPPALARRLLTLALPPDARDHVAGDLDELFHSRCRRDGVRRARRWYWREAFSFATRFLAER